MVVGSPGVEGVAGGELRGGGEASVDLGIPAMVVPSCVWEARQLRGFKWSRTVAFGRAGGSWCIGTDRDEAAAKLTGEVEDDLLASIDD